jgi:transposase
MSIIRKRYTKAEKLAIVNESLEDGLELSELSERYSIHINTISRWRREFAVYQKDAFPGNGKLLLTEEQREIQRLRKELKESQLSNEILKKAMGIISSPNRKNLLS